MLYYEGENTRLYCGDVRAVLRGLPAKSVQTVITSPPYWGLRAYGTDPQVWGGDPSCDHTLVQTPSVPPMTGDSGAASAKQVTNVGGQFGNAWREERWYREGGGLAGSSKEAFSEPGTANAERIKAARWYTAQTCTRCGGWRGELGSEPTPEMFVQHLVEVFQEVHRVLRDDGTVFLNIGDSYFGSGKGPTGHNGIGNQTKRQGFVGGDGTHPNPSRRVMRGPACDNGGTTRSGSPSPGSAYPDLCDGCRVVLPLSYIADSTQRPALNASLHEPINRGNGHLGSAVVPAAAASLAVQESTTLGFSLLLPGECSHCSNCGACLAVLRSSSRDARLCVRRDEYTRDSEMRALVRRNRGTDAAGLAYNLHIQPQDTTLKAKDLVGVPWMLAFALRADGWYLRQDIIWAKPNPMPESVRDRCTRSHEYLFLLTKSSRYYYDAAAIKEPAKLQTVKMPDGWDTRPGAHGQHGWQGRQKGKPNAATVVGRNKRDVWTITTRGYPGAHFATFPPKLVEPCVLAGCPPTGVVLDPFAGSGTVLQVARDHGRQGWGIELNAGYCALAVDRLEGVKGATA